MCQLCLTRCVFLQYTESLIVEHGYTRGEINATTFHLEVRLHYMALLSMMIVLSWARCQGRRVILQVHLLSLLLLLPDKSFSFCCGVGREASLCECICWYRRSMHRA